ncbi:MAG: hypothetical protein AB7U20_14245 [Planctomycetaceae bacterium]
MPVIVQLPTDLESRVRTAAEQAGMAPEDYTIRVLDSHVRDESRRAQAIKLLDEWLAADRQDDGDVPYEQVFRWLDEDRTSPRKLFPPEMKGISW